MHFISIISTTKNILSIQISVTYETVAITPDAIALGNPFWDVSTEKLYFVDFIGKLLFCYSWRTNTTQTLTIDGLKQATFFVPIKDSPGHFAVSAGGSGWVVYWDGSSDRGNIVRKLFTIDPNLTMDGSFTSSEGELFVGTVSPSHCSGTPTHGFYRYTPANGLEQISNGYVSSTGVIIVGDILYHLDGCAKNLTAWDIDPITRAWSMLRFC